MSLYIFLNIRSETPPNTPQRVQISAQQTEHVQDSPEHCHLLNPAGNNLPPSRFNLPNIPPAVPALSNHNADPFGAPGQPAIYNSQTYDNLPAGLAAQVAALPLLPAAPT